MDQQPAQWLVPGDEIAIEADAIGPMSNPVMAGW
jgi:2-keto-4-pentenoate hydratase/2-oxohepta-3-ene-1,7-dioic acid hydratase in catechol pathway